MLRFAKTRIEYCKNQRTSYFEYTSLLFFWQNIVTVASIYIENYSVPFVY